MSPERASFVGIAAALLTGCAALPSIVSMPQIDPNATDPYSQNLQGLSQYIGVYPVETTGPGVVKQATLYAATWRKASTDLLLQRDLANNGQFGMVAAGAYDTARNSLRAAKWWLAGAAGIGLAEERYQVEAQALQYSNGAEAMECVRGAVGAIPSSLWSLYVGGVFAGTLPTDPAPADDAKVAYDTLNGLFDTINRRMSDIANRVRSNVQSKKLSVPSVSDIQNAVKAEQQAASDAPGKSQALKAALFSGQKTLRKEFDDRTKSLGDMNGDVERLGVQASARAENAKLAKELYAQAYASYKRALEARANLAAEADAEARASAAASVARTNLQRTLNLEESKQADLDSVRAAEELERAKSALKLAADRQQVVQHYMDLQTKGADLPPAAYASALQLPAKLDSCVTNIGK